MRKRNAGSAGNSHTYRTGSTNPPKSYRGLVTALLILVIILISIITILGMMNVKLFRLLEEQNKDSMEFSDTDTGVQPASEELHMGIEAPGIGVICQEIASLYRSYNELPPGMYISAVAPGSPAAKADIRPGDVVIAMDSVPVSENADFQQRIEKLIPGNSLLLTIVRQQKEMSITLIVEE